MENTIEIYKPKGGIILAESTVEPQIRLGLQGIPKCGKTFTSLTFPSPIVGNIDRGLGAHGDRTDVIEIPFWDGKFCDSICPRSGINNPPNRKDVYLKWTHDEGNKIPPGHTYITDSLSALEDAFHTEYRINPVVTKKGAEQGFAEWKEKQTYLGEIMSELKGLKCDVILCCHQTENSLKGGFRPLLSGGFADKLESHFTDWFRQFVVEKPIAEKKDEFMVRFGINAATLQQWITSTNNNSIYLWQTQSDEKYDCGTTHLLNAPKYVIAHYKTFLQYGRNKQTTKTNATTIPNNTNQ